MTAINEVFHHPDAILDLKIKTTLSRNWNSKLRNINLTERERSILSYKT